MERNVYQLMKDAKKPLVDTEIRNIIYQTLQGLYFMHKQGMFHRDLKPENLLEYNGTIKIADFGLVKEIRSRPPFTDYVSTRWYRAPEVILRSPNYGPPIDIYAIGAIMAEMFRNYPLFPGASETDQIAKVCQTMGTPTKEEWSDGYLLAKQIGYIFPKCPKQEFSSLIPRADQHALDLIEAMLKYNPTSV